MSQQEFQQLTTKIKAIDLDKFTFELSETNSESEVEYNSDSIISTSSNISNFNSASKSDNDSKINTDLDFILESESESDVYNILSRGEEKIEVKHITPKEDIPKEDIPKEDIPKEDEKPKVKEEIKEKLTTCYICRDVKKCIYKCGCYYNYCNICLKYYIKASHLDKKFIIRKPYNEFTAKCPTDMCPKTFKINSYIEESEYNICDKYRLKTNGEGIINPIHCSVPDCEGNLDKGVCQICQTEICNVCIKVKHEGPCSQNDLDAINNMVIMGGNEVNMCPSCNILLFKRGGCNMFFCWNCSVYFNWKNNTINNDTQKFKERDNYYKKYREHWRKAKTQTEKNSVYMNFQRNIEG